MTRLLRAHAIMTAIMYFLTAAASNTINLGLFTGDFARFSMFLYSFLLLPLVWDPLSPTFHRIALPFAALVSFGQIVAFADIVWNGLGQRDTRFDLLGGGLALRVLVFGWVVGFHLWLVWKPQPVAIDGPRSNGAR